MAKQCTIAILGAGRIGQVHLQSLQVVSGAQARVIVDPYLTPAMTKQIRSIDAEVEISANVASVFSRSDIDAIIICTPTTTHAELSFSAFKKGLHVFCEKPLERNIKKMQKMIAMYEESKLCYQVGFNRRFDANAQEMKRLINTGKVGTPRMLRITSRDPALPSLDYIKQSGGLFFDMMIHDFDMARFLLGQEVREVYASGGVLVDDAVASVGDIDSAVVVLTFTSGVLAYIENCRETSYGYDQRMELLGSKGMCSTENMTPHRALLSDTKGIQSPKPHYFFLERYAESYKNELEGFVKAIQQKNPTTECSIYDGKKAVELAFAAQKSFESNKPVIL